MNKHLFIASDVSGYALKETIKNHLTEQGYLLDDVGVVDIDQPMPFFEAARRGAACLEQGTHARGILICGTGMGMSIVANKHKGVIAAVCESLYTTIKARAINDANVLCLGGWVIGEALGKAMADAFLTTEFTEGLEAWRAKNLKKARQAIQDIETKTMR